MTDFDRREGRAIGASKEPTDPRAEMLLRLARAHGELLRLDGEEVHSVEIIVMRNPKQELASAVAILTPVSPQ